MGVRDLSRFRFGQALISGGPRFEDHAEFPSECRVFSARFVEAIDGSRDGDLDLASGPHTGDIACPSQVRPARREILLQQVRGDRVHALDMSLRWCSDGGRCLQPCGLRSVTPNSRHR